MATAVTTPIENIKFSGDTLYVNLGLYFHYNLVFYSMWNNSVYAISCLVKEFYLKISY
jgi:hypothetical protein